MIITFGKYRGLRLSEIPDAGYLRWLLTLSGDGVAADYVRGNRSDIENILRAEEDAKVAAAPPVSVTPHQQSAVDHLFGLIMSGTHVVALEGGAGYGKSYTVKKLLLQLREAGIASQACATSYVATQVLARDLDPYGFEAKTIAKTLKMSKVIDKTTGKEDYVLTADSHEAADELLKAGRALVVDESSMVSDDIVTLLMDAANRGGGHLILVGDSHQLPPVGQETLSIACQIPDPAVLAEPMRYSRDSVLFQLEQTARNAPWGVLYALSDPAGTPPGNEVVPVRSTNALVDAYVRNYREHPSNTHRMMLFRRADVVAANNSIRDGLYGYQAAVVEDGERLMVLRTSDYPYVPEARLGDTVRYYSGESFLVEATDQQTYHFMGIDIPHWVVRFQGRADPVRVIFAVTEYQMDSTKLGGAEYQAAVGLATQHGLQNRDWEPWKMLTNSFVAVTYQYATSVHRAQGQTTDFAYAAPAPLLAVRGIMGPALAYVALTRARKQITVLV